MNIEKNKDASLSEFRLLTIVTVGVLTTGSVFYHFVEKLSWIDAIYFCVVTLATVGYGDIVPKTPLGKIFTAFYILIGIGIIAFFANALIKRAYHRRMERIKKRS